MTRATASASKKGQSSNEALMIIGFLTFFLILVAAVVSDDIVQAHDENYRTLLDDIAEVIEAEASIAFSSEDGYFHPFRLPPTLNGLPYVTSITNSTLISGQTNTTPISVASKMGTYQINVTRNLPREVRGSLVRGQNTVRKEAGLVIFLPAGLTPAQQAECSTCSGMVELEECCDHLKLCC